MKKILLNCALSSGMINSEEHNSGYPDAGRQKKGFSFGRKMITAFMTLFMMGWSFQSMAQSSTFYSNGTFVVPPGVTSVTITGVGGAGGSGGQDCGNGCGYNPGAPGGYVSQTFTVSQGTNLSVYIGQKGGNGGSNISGGGAGSGGYGYYYGGNGGRTGSSGSSGGGGGGGGATAVIGQGVTLIAGGGGGGGGRCNTANSGTAGYTSTGGSGSTSGGTGSNPGSSDGGGGGGGGGGVSGGSGGGLYSLNGEYAGYGGKSGSNSSGSSTSTSSPYVTISYSAVAGTISPSSQSICSGSQPSNITLTGYAGYIQWQYSTNNSTFYNISGATSATLTSAQMGALTSNRYYRAVVSGVAYSNTATVAVKALPTTPGSASCSSTTQSTANLSWDTSTAGDAITYYWVVGTSQNVTYGSGIAQSTTTTTAATATGLNASTSYYLRVFAATSCGNSSFQTSIPFTTVPLAPGASEATLVRANSFTANWAASTGATGYTLDVSTSPTFATYLAGYPKNVGNVSSYNLVGLNRNTTYYYRVRANNAGGSSVNSNTISLATLPINNFLIEAASGGNIGTQMAGQPFSIKITARDSYNTIVIDFTGSTTITTNSVLTSGSPTSNFVAGVLTSQLITLTQSGAAKTLTATFASESVTSTSNEFTVTPAALDHFTVVPNGTVTAGTPFTVTATAYDTYDNIKTNYGGANDVLNYTGSNNVNWSTTAISSPNNTARIIVSNGNQTFTNGVATVGDFTFYNSDQSQLAPNNSPTITITDVITAKNGTSDPIIVKNAALNNFKLTISRF